MRNPSIEQIKTQATGMWSEILLHLAPSIAPMIQRGRRHGPCDLCGGKDRARCHDDFNETGGIICNQCRGGADGLSVLCWANDWSIKQTIESVGGYLGLTTGQPLPPIKAPSQPAKPEKNWLGERQAVKTIWDAATPDEERLHEYFQSRGLSTIIPTCLRFHLAIENWNETLDHPAGPKLPAMVAPVLLSGKCVALHYTFLGKSGHGKADVSIQRRIQKGAESYSGGAIQLFPAEPGKPLAVGEGVETMMAVMEMTGYAVWSCMNAGMLKKVIIPGEVSEVVICADLDTDKNGNGPTGESAANALAQRLHMEGFKVKISVPPGPIPENRDSLDWLDVLVGSQEVVHG